VRVFGPDEIDAAKQQLGQTKDLAHGPQDPEVRAQVLALHGQGHGPCCIARATGISRKQVARVLASEGITREPSQPASARLPEILKLRRQGYGFATIGRRLGFTRNAVRRAFRRQQQA
jgi:DNA invertase Pin-like site-specific DNA recombinase